MTDDICNTLTVAEAARLLGVSGQTVRARLARGELAGFLVRTSQGKTWRVLRAGILAEGVPPPENVPQTLPERATLAPGVLEALSLLRESLERENALRDENARLRAELASRPLALAEPVALGWWLALWARLVPALGRPG